eukprot:CAMPEP_0115031628 /NCGR_PEP_ID=MMETSP0216-20121206/38653_1 /TAXON_ID=223996 /ORGANISM="Protocruzia adherens, Strain Boccale" /LENGTH=203 /DNA_ID=CAMNT_0002409327 /DNA_START=548 /DNA_END=1159 /DNA_ORIENTATION=+
MTSSTLVGAVSLSSPVVVEGSKGLGVGKVDVSVSNLSGGMLFDESVEGTVLPDVTNQVASVKIEGYESEVYRIYPGQFGLPGCKIAADEGTLPKGVMIYGGLSDVLESSLNLFVTFPEGTTISLHTTVGLYCKQYFYTPKQLEIDINIKERPDDSLSGWQIALIVTGSVLAVAGIIALIWWRQQRHKKQADDYHREVSSNEDE